MRALEFIIEYNEYDRRNHRPGETKRDPNTPDMFINTSFNLMNLKNKLQFSSKRTPIQKDQAITATYYINNTESLPGQRCK